MREGARGHGRVDQCSKPRGVGAVADPRSCPLLDSFSPEAKCRSPDLVPEFVSCAPQGTTLFEWDLREIRSAERSKKRAKLVRNCLTLSESTP